MTLLEAYQTIDSEVAKIRNEDYGNSYDTISSLPLTPEQQKCVLEWFAHKIWKFLETVTWEGEWHHKSYDPLTINDSGAHSYVFDLGDGGRHHPFTGVVDLEKALETELLESGRSIVIAAALGDHTAPGSWWDARFAAAVEAVRQERAEIAERTRNVR